MKSLHLFTCVLSKRLFSACCVLNTEAESEGLFPLGICTRRCLYTRAVRCCPSTPVLSCGGSWSTTGEDEANAQKQNQDRDSDQLVEFLTATSSVDFHVT